MAGTPEIVIAAFSAAFNGSPVRLWRAPGRVNLIGEHTDYNLGFVMPIAIGLECRVATAPSPSPMLEVYSANMNESRSYLAKDSALLQPAGDWADYVFGVATELAAAGLEIKPVRMAIHSTVPIGSGLSSSAAIEVSTALALLDGRPFDKTQLALLCQRAERNFAGVPCGIMDQYVSLFAEAGKAVDLDCRSLTHRSIPLPDVEIVAVNSMVRHDLGESAYPQRVRECASAVETVRQRYPGKSSLRDVGAHELEAVRDSMDAVVFRRARHVVTENRRVEEFAQAAAGGHLMRMGELFLQSHQSLRTDFEVSCEELDYLVEAAISMDGVYGARMTGGGFGGCTVNLVARDRADMFERRIAEAYRAKFRDPRIYRCIASPGASEC